VPASSNASKIENPHDLIVKLRQFASEGKIDEAIKLIKLIEALQSQEIRSQVSTTETPNATQPAITNNFNASEMANPVNNSTDISNHANSTDIHKQNIPIQSDTVNSVNATQKTNIVNDNPSHNDNEKRFHEKKNEIDSKNKDRKKIRD
jgi:hypothetical protein